MQSTKYACTAGVQAGRSVHDLAGALTTVHLLGCWDAASFAHGGPNNTVISNAATRPEDAVVLLTNASRPLPPYCTGRPHVPPVLLWRRREHHRRYLLCGSQLLPRLLHFNHCFLLPACDTR